MLSFSSLLIFLLGRTCLGFDAFPSAEDGASQLKCPGECSIENTCRTALNETDCEHGLVCCVDNLERIQSEFEDWDLATEGTDLADFVTETGYPYNTEGKYEYVYSEPSEIEMGPREEPPESCPGVCTPTELSSTCEYVMDSENACRSGLTCCLTAAEVQNDQLNYELENQPNLVKRESEFMNREMCPGTCVHPSHAMFCDEILHQFPCPLNAKCCIKRSMERAHPSAVTDCSGQCLPQNMYGYCFPPNELVLGPTTCPRRTACCMRRLADKITRPPTINRMQFPGFPSATKGPVYDGSQVVMGHLAVDDTGTVFKVGTNGQISPLPRLTMDDHVGNKYAKLTAYPRFDGEIVIYSDLAGGLYQQFYPRRVSTFTGVNSQPPVNRQPIYQFDSQALENVRLEESRELVKDEVPEEQVLDDIVIPDDDEDAPVTTNSPVLHDEKNSRPPCPGSCISYYLRFTCFRGYATYDGFSCSSRSVCCARLKDIEDHEAYLRSLSPYFNTPPTSRDSSLPRCGIKGRRDTPRVIGGSDSLPGEYCWQIAIINVQNQYICGGALIDNSWVLTAAHCVVGPMKENQAIFARAGVTDLKSPEDNSNGQTIRVLSTFIHHNFNSMNLDNNVALLRLQKPLELGSQVCVICLPTSGKMPNDDTRCTVSGYGFVSKDGDMSLKIREARVPIIDDTECMTNVTEALNNPFILPASSFCAGGYGQQDACQGDAGGPLACEIGGFHELIGLVSWGLGCGREDVPSIYVKVPSFMGWINQIISSNSFLMSLH